MEKKALIWLIVPILFFVSFNMGASDRKNVKDSNSSFSFELLSDSIKKIVSNREFIIYDYGHHGKKWCLIYEKGDSYDIIIGTTRNEPHSFVSVIDTMKLMDSYRDLICWGIDTLPYITKDMVWQYPKQWSSFYHSLSVFNEHSNCIFNSNNAMGFEGFDSIVVNDNFSRLCYLMHWLSAPEIRSLLPGFEEYVK